jgi:Domain of Unknown Function (DUF1080)
VIRFLAVNRREWLLTTGAGLAAAVLPGRTGAQAEWTPLFDGVTLGQWEQTAFGGEGPVRIVDGALILEMGDPLTGVTWTGAVKTMDYEIALQASRLAGSDFFCGLTFPVAESHCSLILGGWGGTTVGLSSLDGRDASENETTRELRFEDKRWYGVRLAVSRTHIRAWLDDQPIVDVATTGKRIGIRPEVELSRPLGIAAYRTRAGLRAIRLRPLSPP